MRKPYPKQKMLTKAITSALMLAACGSGMNAYAQKALDEVIVTAQKKDDTLQTVPMTVNAVTSETIEKYNMLDFEDVAQVTPGLTIEGVNARTANVSLRGVQVSTDAAAGVAVAVYWNEVNFDIDSAFKAMYDVSQVEVLRGPQGTLRGITAPAGAITIATKTPSYSNLDGYVQQSFSDQNLSNTQFGVSLPIVEDMLALRLAGVYDHNDGNGVKNVLTDTSESAETRSGRLTIGFRPTNDIEANLIYQHLENIADSFSMYKGDGLNGPSLRTYDRKTVADLDGSSHSRRDIATLNVNWDLDGHELIYVGGYQRQILDNINDLDPGNSLPDTVQFQSVLSNITSWTHELRFSSVDADFYNYTYGLFYSRGSSSTIVDNPSWVGNFPAPLIVSTIIVTAGPSENFAAFTNQGFQLTDATEAQVGLRYQSYRQAQDNSLGGAALEKFVAIDEAVTGSASISHQLTDDVRIYANYGRSFRPGGRSPVPASPTPLQAGTWDSETSDSIELGFKSRLNDGRLQINGDLFYQKFHDFISRASNIWTNNSEAGVLSNSYTFNYSSNVIVQGAELSVDALLTDNWQLGSSVSYTDAKYDDADKPCNQFDGTGAPMMPPTGEYFVCPSNGRLGTEPNWMASITSEYVWPMGEFEPFVRGLYTFRSGRADDNVVDGDTASYGVFNLFLGLRDGKRAWEVSLWAKNLFDHQATTSVSSEQINSSFFGDVIDSGYRQVTIIPEREIGITGKYNFSM
jgi:iron complex outermembrane recepter protein